MLGRPFRPKPEAIPYSDDRTFDAETLSERQRRFSFPSSAERILTPSVLYIWPAPGGHSFRRRNFDARDDKTAQDKDKAEKSTRKC